MSARKSVLLVLAAILVSSLTVYALAAGVQVRTLTTSPILPNPNHKPGAPVAPIQVLSCTVVTPTRPPGSPPTLPLHPVLVVVRRVDSYTSILHGACVKHTSFAAATVSTYMQLPTGTQTLTHKVVLADAKITDDHTFTDTKQYGSVPMESVTFSYFRLTDTAVTVAWRALQPRPWQHCPGRGSSWRGPWPSALVLA